MEGINIDLICFWCGKKTSGNEKAEHIFQACIGGKKTLPKGFVCSECNDRFGQRKHGIDEAMEYVHPWMMHAYQLHEKLLLRKKKDESRKKKQKNIVQGKYEAEGSEIAHNESFTILTNTNHTVTSEKFVRALHKCLANIICEKLGPIKTKENFAELLEFVKNGGDVRPWSYAVSDFKPVYNNLPIEPHVRTVCQFNGSRIIMGFIHVSGIWILGSHPYLLNPCLIEDVSKKMKLILNFPKFILHDDRDLIGPYFMHWVVKEVEGRPDPDNLYVLTKCRVCGQTNPTGEMLPREILNKGNTNHTMSYGKNTWNSHDDEQGVSMPIENDVKKMKIKNNQTRCINCGSKIYFNAADCFV